MSRVWLPPTRSKPFPNPQTERQDLINRLYDARTYLPEANVMEIEQLRDYVEEYEARYITENMEPVLKKDPKVLNQAERDAIKEYLAWKRKRAEGKDFFAT